MNAVHDTVLDVGGLSADIDKIELASGIAVTDVDLTKSYNDLVVSINGGQSSVTIKNFYLGSHFIVEKLLFHTGETWELVEMAPTGGTSFLLMATSDDEYRTYQGYNSSLSESDTPINVVGVQDAVGFGELGASH